MSTFLKIVCFCAAFFLVSAIGAAPASAYTCTAANVGGNTHTFNLPVTALTSYSAGALTMQYTINCSGIILLTTATFTYYIDGGLNGTVPRLARFGAASATYDFTTTTASTSTISASQPVAATCAVLLLACSSTITLYFQIPSSGFYPDISATGSNFYTDTLTFHVTNP